MFVFQNQKLQFDCYVHTFNDIYKIFLMINTKKSILNFVNTKFVKYYQFFTIAFIKSMRLRFVDDATIFNIIHVAQMKFQLNEYVKKLWYLIIALKSFNFIMNWFWIKQHEIIIFEKKKVLIFDFDDCLKKCNLNYRFIIVYIRKIRTKNFFNDFQINYEIDIVEVFALTFFKMIKQNKNQIIAI